MDKLIIWHPSHDILKKIRSGMGDTEMSVPDSENDIVACQKKLKADVLIMPYDMKQNNSLEILRKIREVDKTVKVIITMDKKNASAIIEYLTRGANEILIEPVTAEKISQKIADIRSVHLQP